MCSFQAVKGKEIASAYSAVWLHLVFHVDAGS